MDKGNTRNPQGSTRQIIEWFLNAKLDINMIPFVKSPYNYDNDKNSLDNGLDNGEDLYPSMTQQQFKEETDINTIVRRFGLTGELPDNPRMPVSGDFTGISDFHSAMNAVMQAEESFMELPPHLRARFANDPQKLMDFIADDNNRQEAEKLGLLKPQVTEQPIRVTIDTPQSAVQEKTHGTKEKRSSTQRSERDEGSGPAD